MSPFSFSRLKMVLINIDTLYFVADRIQNIPTQFPKRQDIIINEVLNFQSKNQFKVSIQVSPTLESLVESELDTVPESKRISIIKDLINKIPNDVKLPDVSNNPIYLLTNYVTSRVQRLS